MHCKDLIEGEDNMFENHVGIDDGKEILKVRKCVFSSFWLAYNFDYTNIICVQITIFPEYSSLMNCVKYKGRLVSKVRSGVTMAVINC